MAEPDSVSRRDGMYLATDGRIFSIKRLDGGEEQLNPLSNFDAQIVADVSCTDGLEAARAFEIEAVLGDRTTTFRVPAARFGAMNWIAENIGASAYVTATQGSERKLREAIPRLSGKITQRTIFAHAGWTRSAGGWIYLHAGGAIGATGAVPDIEVELPGAMANFRLPEPIEGDALHSAITSAIGLLDLAPFRVTAPLFGAIWRSVLGPADFALSLAGRTGIFKSELAALAMQFFGAGFDARHLPGSWSSTANFLRALAFLAKDALLIVDDFVPTGTRIDVAKQHREASALLRDGGNAAGRGRLSSDASMRPVKPPRGLIVSTGEENFRGESLQGRLLTIELAKGDVSAVALTHAQERAADGVYSRAMAAYLRWLAPRLDETHDALKAERVTLRAKATRLTGHSRTPGLVADLFFGAQTFFRFAVDSSAMPQHLADGFLAKVWDGLLDAASAHDAHVHEGEPCERFLTLLRAAIASGSAHFAAVDGTVPVDALASGWRLEEFRASERGEDVRMTGRLMPLGPCVGWVDGDDIFLTCDAALKAANAVATDGTALTIPGAVLRKRLKEKRLLKTSGESRGRSTITVLKTIAGARIETLHFARETILPADEKTIAKTEEHKDERSVGNS